jgi:hypothetical protein
VVALYGRARRGWSCLAGPRRRRPSSASDAPGRPTLPQAPLATAHRVTSPVVSQTPPTSRVQGRAPRLEAPPQVVLRPAPRPEKPGGSGPGFRPTSLRCCPSTTPPGTSGTPMGAALVAYSPGLPRWCSRLFLRALRVSPYSTGFASLRLPPSSGTPTRPAGRAQRFPR